MDWGQVFSSENLRELALPVGVGIVIIAVLLFLRRFLYRYIRRLVAKTHTQFDDILIRETRVAIILWCFWLGIFVGFTVYNAPEAWSVVTNKLIPVLYTALGIYTLISFIMATLKWYKVEICPRTASNLDDIIMGTLIFGTPLVGGGLGLILILKMLGYESLRVNAWLAAFLPGLAFLAILGTTILLLTVLIVPRVIQTLVRNSRAEQTEEELRKRADTLVGVITTTLQIIIIFLFILMAIGQVFGWQVITPVLTATGVVGIAVGFGAQSLVKDVISGLFIILENQYRKGDVVGIAGASGVVEEINLRRTILRDMDGVTHVIPNGQINVSSNYTKQVSKVNMNIGVSYDTDLDKAMAVINGVGKEMAEDPQWVPFIITPPRALRVDKLGDSSVEIKVVADTKPSQQWSITGELRLRIKKAFDKEGIEIPWPHTKVYFGNQPPIMWQKELETRPNTDIEKVIDKDIQKKIEQTIEMNVTDPKSTPKLNN